MDWQDKMKKIFIYNVLIGLFLTGCGSNERPDSNSQAVAGKSYKTQPPRPAGAVKAPEFTLATPTGELVSLSQMKGKVILLNFWGTWCGPCRIEIPDFIKLYNKYHESGLEIVGITLPRSPQGEDPRDILEFMDNWKMNYTVLTDINGQEAQQVTALYGQALGKPIYNIPTTLIIDRDGYIVKEYLGPRSEAVFYNDIKPYL